MIPGCLQLWITTLPGIVGDVVLGGDIVEHLGHIERLFVEIGAGHGMKSAATAASRPIGAAQAGPVSEPAHSTGPRLFTREHHGPYPHRRALPPDR